jgi:hypothetical protein
VAIGTDSGAVTQNGSNNRAYVRGTRSSSAARDGDNNVATTIGRDSSAVATGGGKRVTTFGNNKHNTSSISSADADSKSSASSRDKPATEKHRGSPNN